MAFSKVILAFILGGSAFLTWSTHPMASSPNYLRILNSNSPGNVMHSIQNNLNQVEYYCNLLPSCVAYTSTGDLLSELLPRGQWTTVDPVMNGNVEEVFSIFVKSTASIPPDEVSGNYEVYYGCNFARNNLYHMWDRRAANLQAQCDHEWMCTAFNSYGWLKNDVPLQNVWICDGNPDVKLYIKGQYDTYKTQTSWNPPFNENI